MIHEPVSIEVRFNNLTSHYKDAYTYHLATLKERNRLFVYLLIIFVVFIVQFQEFSLIQEICNELIQKKLNVSADLTKFVPVILWFALMSISLRYFQINIQVERQYDYIYLLEEEINKQYRPSKAFTRDGITYLTDYPTILNWFDALYTCFFPIALLVSIIIKIRTDLAIWPQNYLTISCFFAYEITGVTTILYLKKIYSKKIKKIWNNKNKLKFFKKI